MLILTVELPCLHTLTRPEVYRWRWTPHIAELHQQLCHVGTEELSTWWITATSRMSLGYDRN
jgi:hypothetical protein